MRDAEQYEIPALYVVIQYGEVHSHSHALEAALKSAEECVHQILTDFWRHKLPFQATPEFIRDLDVRVYCLNSASQVTMPVQAWIDDYHKQSQDYIKESAEDEYRRFVALRQKHEERFQRERAVTPVPNCS